MKNILILIPLFFLSGCFEKEEKTYTVDYFLKNRVLLNETHENCLNNPGELSKTPNCMNSRIANRRVRSGSSSDIHL